MFDEWGGAAAAVALAAVTPADLGDADLVEVMQAWERLAAWVAAGQLAAIAELARRRPRDYAEHGPGHVDAGDPRVQQISEFAVDEVAAALRLTRLAAGVRVQLAVELDGRLPGTAAALHAGRIDVPRARVIMDGTGGLEGPLVAAVEARVLPRAPEQTTGQLRASLARAVLAVDPAAAEVRHERAVAERQVTVRPLPDGMAGLWALLPADGATALYARLDHLARQAPPSDARPMDARRADALLTLTLGAGSVSPRSGCGGGCRGGRRGGVGGGRVRAGPRRRAGSCHRGRGDRARPGRPAGPPGRARSGPGLDGTPPRRARRLAPGPHRPVQWHGCRRQPHPLHPHRRPRGPGAHARCGLPVSRLPAAGSPLRPRPRHSLAGRPDHRGQPRHRLPAPPPPQTPDSLDRPHRTPRRADLDQPQRPGVRDDSERAVTR